MWTYSPLGHMPAQCSTSPHSVRGLKFHWFTSNDTNTTTAQWYTGVQKCFHVHLCPLDKTLSASWKNQPSSNELQQVIRCCH